MDSENKCFHKRPVTRPQKEIAPSLPSDNRSLKAGFPIRRFPDQSLFAAPRDLSQRTTSFIASQRQGIHRIPLRHLIALIARTRSRRPGEDKSMTPSSSLNDSIVTSPSSPEPKMSRRFEKTSFASNASGIQAVRLTDHDWYARGGMTAIRATSPMDITSKTLVICKARLYSRPHRPIRPRPNALPLHNVIRSESPPNRRRRTPHRPKTAYPYAFKTANAALKTKLMLHRIFLQKPPRTRQAPARSSGGARRDRTDDLMLAKHALSQLSYGPKPGTGPPRQRGAGSMNHDPMNHDPTDRDPTDRDP